jgi:hypothetical protein
LLSLGEVGLDVSVNIFLRHCVANSAIPPLSLSLWIRRVKSAVSSCCR